MTSAQSRPTKPAEDSTTALRVAGLDLIGTQAAVGFQNVSSDNFEERIRDGLQTLTEATGADAVFVALLDRSGQQFQQVYAGRATFSACNPEVLKSRELPGVRRGGASLLLRGDQVYGDLVRGHGYWAS